MAERRPSAGSSALNQVDKNYKYGGDSAIGALLLPVRREILQEEQNQLINYDDRGRAIVQTLPAKYGESEVDFSYSPIVRGAKATGSFLNDIFFGDANEQAEAAGRAVSAVRGVVGGLGDYASSQYEAGMAGGTTYDPETRQITEFDPTAVLLSNAPAGIQAVRNAPPNTMTLGAAGGRMNPARNIDTEVSEAKAAYDLDPNNEELRQSYMALRRERDSVPSLPRIRRGRGSAIRVFHGSPHEFENFSMGNIGTGEGAQAYGYGLYFAESPEIARSYRDQLSQSGGSIGGRPIMDDYNSIIERADRLPPAAAQIEYDKAAFLEDLELTDDIAESISRIENPEVAKWARSEVAPQFKPAGYSYEANLNVTIDDLLDYDELLSDQPDAILNKLRNTDWFEFAEESLDLDLADNPTGGDLLKWLSQDYNPQEVSQILSGIGIKGTKYFDANSRNRGNNQERTSNYVIFDDSLVDTKRVNDKLTPSWMDQGARMERAEDLGYDMDNVFYHGTNKTFEEFDASLGEGARKDTGVFVSNSPDVASSYAGGTSAQVLPLRVRLQNPIKVYADGNNWSKLGPNTRIDLPRRVVNQSKDADLLEELGFDRGSNTRTEPMGTYTLGELFPDHFGGIKDAKLAELFGKDTYLPMTTNDISRWAKKQGVDGVIFEDISDRGSRGSFDNDKASMPSRNAVIFDPKDIRSVNAEFDPTKADSADLLSSRQSERQMSALRGIA
jgi:hypothetical protein